MTLLNIVLLAGAGVLSSPAATLPVRIILVGDSTTAPNNGWGPGFCALLKPDVVCLNMAKNGRSTSSYRAEGSWDEVLTKLKDNSAFSATYVTIQFGHNDQPGKPGRSTDLVTEYPANLRAYVRELKAAGAKPILITPLTRRMFKDGKLNDTLGPWADATRAIAKEENVPVLELNADSAAAVQKMGAVEANTMAWGQPSAEFQAAAAKGNALPIPPAKPGDTSPVFDYTHLGPKGSDFFGRMVLGELTAAIPDLRAIAK